MAKRVDTNHRQIVAALEAVGATVESLHTLGKGCPDLLIGFRGCNYALEVKTLAGKLNPDQVKWHTYWRGQVAVVTCVEQALAVIGAVMR